MKKKKQIKKRNVNTLSRTRIYIAEINTHIQNANAHIVSANNSLRMAAKFIRQLQSK